MAGRPFDVGTLDATLRSGIVDVIRKQAAAGIDVISDGEVGKLGFGVAYYGRRYSGLESRPLRNGEAPFMALRTNERIEFADFYQELQFVPPSTQRAICSGPIRFIGDREVQKGFEAFKGALADADVKAEECFICVLAPGWLEHFFYNEHYSTEEEYLFAWADAVRHEYRAVVDAGFVLQIDDPALPDTYDMIVPLPTIQEYRKFAAVRVEALNRALQGIPEDRVRYHICWGSWHGPHTHDLPLTHVVDLMLNVRAGGYSIEAANPRHEHEWKVWKDVRLPDGKILIPGVVSHASNVVEHPELVADRIVRYASLVGRENVVAGTDCGMGMRVHPQIAWAKLKALAEGAAIATRELWGRHDARASS